MPAASHAASPKKHQGSPAFEGYARIYGKNRDKTATISGKSQ